MGYSDRRQVDLISRSRFKRSGGMSEEKEDKTEGKEEAPDSGPPEEVEGVAA